MPLKPMNAMDIKPNVIKSIATPLKGSGTSDTETLSLMDVMANNKILNPSADPSPKINDPIEP